MLVKPQSEEERKAHSSAIPAGRYAIAPTEFSLKQNKAKTAYFIRTKYVVIGPKKFAGKTFYDATSLDLSKDGVCFRWQLWMEAIGVEEPVIGTPPEMSIKECERNIAKYFMFRGFIADITRSDDGQYVNNGIAKLFAPGKWSEQEMKAIRNWEEEQKVKLLDEGDGTQEPDDDIPFGNDAEIDEAAEAEEENDLGW
jgi:hypothetical protein